MKEDERYILEGKSFIDTMTNQCLNYGIKDLIRVCIALNNQDTQIVMLQQQLTDHDKEVRKQVCDEIRKFIENKTCLGYIDEQKPNDFYEFLDQIEKGDKE